MGGNDQNSPVERVAAFCICDESKKAGGLLMAVACRQSNRVGSWRLVEGLRLC